MTDLTAADAHFAFGKNWRSFANLINDDRIAASDRGIARLFQGDELEGRQVIDIGCGSGLPALSLLRLGARHVTCIDIDENSVAAARRTLEQHAPASAWSASPASVFDLEGSYDVVHSWGVLHHTGAMWRAIDKAASLVGPDGLLAIAIYCKTPLCRFWTVEKRLYSRAPRPLQLAALGLFTVWRTLIEGIATGKPLNFLRSGMRGMDWWHDQHDWLGGYPYESATPEEVRTFLAHRGFVLVRENLLPGNRRGLLGSGCDEYVFRRS